MGDLTESPTASRSPASAPAAAVAQSAQTRVMPVREDCWTEEATGTLVEAWGRRYVELNRGNLRQKDWQDVADAVNALHGHTKKTFRTDVQCKNRIDTIKKKYKVEKARVESSNGAVTSPWPFYERMDALIGSSVTLKKPSPPQRFSPPPAQQAPSTGRYSPPLALPLPYKKGGTTAPMALALPQKRPAVDEGFFRRNYSAMAAAAAAAENEDEDEDDEEDEGDEGGGAEGRTGWEEVGIKKLAKAIERFGEVYQRVEAEKLRQMVELEKKRMQFAKELEEQRMKMFMDTQIQLERIKRSKRSGSSDIYS